MCIEWDVPIAMEDGVVLRADMFRPVEDGRYPVIVSYGPYGKGVAFQEGFKAAWDKMVARLPRDRPRFDQQVRRVRSGRSGEMGAGRLRDACASTAAAPAARRASWTSSRSARRSDLYAVHRMGRAAALVHRQGRAQRHLLLRDQPVVRGLDAAAAPRRDLRVGGRRRLLSREHAPRRHPVQFLRLDVSVGGLARCSTAPASAARRARSPASMPAGPKHCRTRSWSRTASTSRSRCCRTRSTTPITATARRNGRKIDGAGADRRQLGRPWACTRAATSKASCARHRAQKWLEAHGDTHWTHFYTDYGVGCRSASSAISSKARTPAGTSSRRCSCRSATSTGSSSGTRTNGRSRARNGPGSISTRGDRSLRRDAAAPAATLTYDPTGRRA